MKKEEDTIRPELRHMGKHFELKEFFQDLKAFLMDQ